MASHTMKRTMVTSGRLTISNNEPSIERIGITGTSGPHHEKEQNHQELDAHNDVINPAALKRVAKMWITMWTNVLNCG